MGDGEDFGMGQEVEDTLVRFDPEFEGKRYVLEVSAAEEGSGNTHGITMDPNDLCIGGFFKNSLGMTNVGRGLFYPMREITSPCFLIPFQDLLPDFFR